MKRFANVVGALAVLLSLGASAPVALANLACGIPPITPVGCKVGPCACDQNGQNCHWTFVCE